MIFNEVPKVLMKNPKYSKAWHDLKLKQYKQELIEKLKKAEWLPNPNSDFSETSSRRMGFNDGLDKAIELIKETK